MSDDLRRVERDVSNRQVKFNPRQCDCLRRKLTKTLRSVERIVSASGEIRYGKVLHELYVVAQRVQSLIRDCCYEDWECSVAAATKVTDSEERFYRYHVELEWCSFLLKCIDDCSEGRLHLVEKFDWEKELESIKADPTILKAASSDKSQIVELLKRRLQEEGDHRVVCRFLLQARYTETVDEILGDDLEIPSHTEGRLLGGGAQGSVYEITWKGARFAKKVIRDVDPASFNKEVKVFGDVCHPHILNMFCSFEHTDPPQGSIMMELAEQDLNDLINKRKESKPDGEPPFTLLEAVDILLQISEGMLYIHDVKKVALFDLKPKNILVNTDPVMVVKVCDFGLAKMKQTSASRSEVTPNVGTTQYRAPELSPRKDGKNNWWAFGRGRRLSRSEPCIMRENGFMADVYNFGITASVVVTGKNPFDRLLLTQISDMVRRGGRPALPTACPLRLLIEECWHPTPSKRPKFAKICKDLRMLKAVLLTGGDFTQQIGILMTPEYRSSLETHYRLLVDNNTARGIGDSSCTRILVIGKSDSGKTRVGDLICGVASTSGAGTERTCSSPPMRLRETGGLDERGEMHGIERLVHEKNHRWGENPVYSRWHQDLRQHWPIATTAQEWLQEVNPDRFDMVWLVRSVTDPVGPEWYKLKHSLLERYQLPMQILVTETSVEQDANGSLFRSNFLSRFKDFFPTASEDEMGERIMKVDLRASRDLPDPALRILLGATSQACKLKGQIGSVARIIAKIRKTLNVDGFRIPTSHLSRTKKSYSLAASCRFVFLFMCAYWDVPRELHVVLAKRVISWEYAECAPASKEFEIRPGRFVIFCMRAACVIVRSRALRPDGWTSARPNFTSWEAEVDDCDVKYLRKLHQEELENAASSNEARLRTYLQNFLLEDVYKGSVVELEHLLAEASRRPDPELPVEQLPESPVSPPPLPWTICDWLARFRPFLALPTH